MISSVNRTEVLPARYDLSLSKDGLSINVSFCSGLFSVLYELYDPKIPFVQMLREAQKELNLPELVFPQDNSKWGFGSVLEFIEASSVSWGELSVKLPVFKKPRQDWDWKMGYATALSLKSFFFVINPTFEELPAVSDSPQLIVIEGMLVQTGMHGAGISVGLSEQVKNWIINQQDDSWTKILIESMKKAYCHMWQEPKSTKYQMTDFRVTVDEKGYLYVVVPGDCCCMGDFDKHAEFGSYLSSHNCDGPMQQLTFLVGFAKLNELVRASL